MTKTRTIAAVKTFILFHADNSIQDGKDCFLTREHKPYNACLWFPDDAFTNTKYFGTRTKRGKIRGWNADIVVTHVSSGIGYLHLPSTTVTLAKGTTEISVRFTAGNLLYMRLVPEPRPVFRADTEELLVCNLAMPIEELEKELSGIGVMWKLAA